MTATGVSKLQPDRIGYFVSEDPKKPDHQSTTEESEVEDMSESMATFIDLLLFGWVLAFAFVAMTEALRPQQHDSWHAKP